MSEAANAADSPSAIATLERFVGNKAFTRDGPDSDIGRIAKDLAKGGKQFARASVIRRGSPALHHNHGVGGEISQATWRVRSAGDAGHSICE